MLLLGKFPPFTSIPNQRKCRISEEPLHDNNEVYSISYSWLQKLSAIENCDESVIPPVEAQQPQLSRICPFGFSHPWQIHLSLGRSRKLIINRETGREEQSSKLSAKRKRSQASLP
uniref:Uncharacterized protein n=1 Tax=Zosterops lateralis melanops TaxID=1220523 RepID=A0A8D2QVY4_ZOSLA